ITGQDPVPRNHLRKSERLGLWCWEWETEGRQLQEQRYKPRKSSKHDEPWRPGYGLLSSARQTCASIAQYDPYRWAPRRWFGPCPPGKPLQISIVSKQTRRQQLDDEFYLEENPKSSWVEGLEAAGLRQRKDPKADGFWSVHRTDGKLQWAKKHPKWEPCKGPLDTKVWEVEPLHPHRPLRCDVPIWRARYEPEIDVDPPSSVLEQRHERPDATLVPVLVGNFRLGLPPEWVNNFHDTRGRLSQPCSPPPIKSGAAWWKTKPARRYRYWDQHAIAAGQRWPTRPNRRGRPYTLDLKFKRVKQYAKSMQIGFTSPPILSWQLVPGDVYQGDRRRPIRRALVRYMAGG